MTTLEQHLYQHHRIGMDAEYRVACLCGQKFRIAEDHAAHQAATWREARAAEQMGGQDG